MEKLTNEQIKNFRDAMETEFGETYPLTVAITESLCDELLELRKQLEQFKREQ